MKLLNPFAIGAFFCSLFLLPSFIIEEASLQAEQAIQGRTIGLSRVTSGRSLYSSGGSRTFPDYTNSSRQITNGLVVYTYNQSSRSGRRTVPASTKKSGYVNLNELSLNQALPDPPDVNLNISQSSDSKKALVRWNID